MKVVPRELSIALFVLFYKGMKGVFLCAVMESI